MRDWRERLYLAFGYAVIPAFMYYVVFQYLYHYQEAPDPRYHFILVFIVPTFFRAMLWLLEPYWNPVFTLLCDYVIVMSLMAVYHNVGQPYQVNVQWGVIAIASVHVFYLFVRGWMEREGPYSDIISLFGRRASS